MVEDSAQSAVCGILPPHILRRLAESGDPDARAIAYATLDASAFIRGERAMATLISQVLSVSPGHRRRTVYDARSKRDLPGIRVRGEGEKKTKDLAVDEAYDGAGKTYDFFAEVMGRRSIDDRGMRLDATVHYGVRFANAQWNGRQIIYGDGDGKLFHRFTRSLDVIGHELTHGVTQHTAGLVYQDQPGALSEHFADVFGVLVKQHARRQKARDADWLVGAELFTRAIDGEAVRSMKAPGTAYDDPLIGKDPQPAHMRDYVNDEDDNGGVHINSGIPNIVFYRVAEALGGFAWEVAGKIWYQALTSRLRRQSDFAACARATADIAGELYGPGSEPQEVVASAWKSVGIAVRVAQRPRARIPIRARAELAVATGAAEIPSDIPLIRHME